MKFFAIPTVFDFVNIGTDVGSIVKLVKLFQNKSTVDKVETYSLILPRKLRKQNRDFIISKKLFTKLYRKTLHVRFVNDSNSNETGNFFRSYS